MRVKTARMFRLNRVIDDTGVSGTGIVAVGIKFPSGRCIIEWCSHWDKRSLGVYRDEEEMLGIHGHDGKTRIEWLTHPLDFKMPIGIDLSLLPDPLKL